MTAPEPFGYDDSAFDVAVTAGGNVSLAIVGQVVLILDPWRMCALAGRLATAAARAALTAAPVPS